MNGRKPTLLDCFAGIGGFSLAFESEGFETIGFVESDEIKRIVLRYWWPGGPILQDARDTEAIAEFCRTHGGIDALSGGIPCQPTSALGQQRGTSDERWLWPDAIRLVRAIRPCYAVFENPPALLNLEDGRAFNGIVSELVALGYDLRWDVLPACAFGAGHERERVIIIASDAMRCGRRTWWPRGLDSHCEGQAKQAHEAAFTSNGHGERRTETRKCVSSGEQGPSNLWTESATDDCQTSPSDTESISERIQANEVDAITGSWNSRLKSSSDGNSSLYTDANCPRLQGHAGDGDGGRETRGGYEEARRPIATPDLRGRGLERPDWWHEVNTGIPVLASGIPNKLVEAASRCIGDAVVPQVIQPVARTIYQMLTT